MFKALTGETNPLFLDDGILTIQLDLIGLGLEGFDTIQPLLPLCLQQSHTSL
jgi:hypothetical protein